MPATSASASAKSILFGEHAVVYGQPAIAIPLHNLRTKVYITADPLGKPGIQLLDAPDIQIRCFSNELKEGHPLRSAIQSVVDFFQLEHFPACEIRISSSIPIAAGLGSSASTAVAMIRGLINFLGKTVEPAIINQLAFIVEKSTHGNPSGIDNTVIVFEKPVFFIKNGPQIFLNVADPFYFIIGDTGIRSLTKEVVSQVREKWENKKGEFELIFNQIGEISRNAKEALIKGMHTQVGDLMNKNHTLLKSMGVSCVALDHLVDAAMLSGALGAKLCGSGQGGNIIALIKNQSDGEKVQEALMAAGAARTYHTQLRNG
jgi:mevalonate kinase